MRPPNIIFWNVASRSVGFPAAADQPGVILLSGFSPSLLKFVLSGELEQETAAGVDADGALVTATAKSTPLAMLHTVLHDAGLDAVRDRLASVAARL